RSRRSKRGRPGWRTGAPENVSRLQPLRPAAAASSAEARTGMGERRCAPLPERRRPRPPRTRRPRRRALPVESLLRPDRDRQARPVLARLDHLHLSRRVTAGEVDLGVVLFLLVARYLVAGRVEGRLVLVERVAELAVAVAGDDRRRAGLLLAGVGDVVRGGEFRGQRRLSGHRGRRAAAVLLRASLLSLLLGAAACSEQKDDERQKACTLRHGHLTWLMTGSVEDRGSSFTGWKTMSPKRAK